MSHRFQYITEVAAGSLVIVVIPGFRIKRNLELFWRKNRDLPLILGPLEQVAREMIDILKERAREVLPNTMY